jgi:FAD/FMN-containing dehydrogenase
MRTADLESLQRALAGDVLVPGSPGYEDARRPFAAQFSVLRPRALVRCATAGDVAESISLARRSALPTAIRSGGHCFAGRSSTDGILVDVTPMDSVSVADGVASVGAGGRLGAVYEALLEHDVTIPAGSCPSVGIAGQTLGGGLGILGRRYGLTSDRLVGAEVVLADGRVVRCDEHHEGELFWALRGGGAGTLGVVTSLRFAPVPTTSVTNVHLTWPWDAAAAAVAAWQAWAPAAPDELAASLLLKAEGEAGRPPAVHLFGAVLGRESAADDLLDGLVGRVGVGPVSDERRHLPRGETRRWWAELGAAGEEPSDAYPLVKSEFFAEPLPPEAIATLVDMLAEGRLSGEVRELDFTPWGGAYNRVPRDATAFVHRDAQFLLKHATEADPKAPVAARESARRWLAGSWALAHRWGTGGVFPNFPDRELADWGRSHYGGNLERLLAVKRRYDPDDVFQVYPSPTPPEAP